MENIVVAHRKAIALFASTRAPVTELSPAIINATRSFAVLPDGSKEGWDESD